MYDNFNLQKQTQNFFNYSKQYDNAKDMLIVYRYVMSLILSITLS